MKYEVKNGEVYAEIAGSRPFWALGFKTDRMYPSRVSCQGCPADPFAASKTNWREGQPGNVGLRVFDPATIERPFPGLAIRTPDSLSGGPGFNVDYMTPVADFLPASYQRVFYEQRGPGRSLVANLSAQNMTLRHVVDDLDALRVHLKQERVFLVGHSWGGMLAMAYAATHPDRIARMILIGSGGPTLEFASWFNDNLHMRLRPEDVEAERYWDQAPARGIDADKAALESLKAIMPGYFFERAKGLALAAQIPDGTLHVRVNTLLFEDMAKAYDSRPGLRRSDRPVLIVQGHQDPVGDKTAEDIHASIKGSVLAYIHKCGYFPRLEQPEEFRRIVSEFLDSTAKR